MKVDKVGSMQCDHLGSGYHALDEWRTKGNQHQYLDKSLGRHT